MSPDQFLTFAQVLPEPMLLVTGTSEILAINRAANKLFSGANQGLVGQNLTAFVHEPSEKVADYLLTCARSRQMILGALTLHQGKDAKTACRAQGAVVQAKTADSPATILLRLEKREGSKFSILNQKVQALSGEIRKRQQAQLELSQSNEALQQTLVKLKAALDVVQTEKMTGLGQLAAGIAHEINNPISFIYGNVKYVSRYCRDLLDLVHLYQQDCPDPSPAIQNKLAELELDFLEQDLEKVLNSLQRGSDRVADIVQGLRNFSRLDEAEFKSVDIHEGLEATLMILQNRFNTGHHSAPIEVIKHYTPLTSVYCSPGHLNQVYLNILSNAIEALEGDTREASDRQAHCIWIRTEQLNKNTVAIHIKDNGTGISAEIQKQIFDPFFTTKPVGKGTGLGLSISYRIIESHGGQIRVQSTPDLGTEFSIELPITFGSVAS